MSNVNRIASGYQNRLSALSRSRRHRRLINSMLETLHERIEQRDKAMRKEYAARLQANKEIGRKRDEEDPSRKEKRNAAIRKKRKKAAKAAK